MERLKRREYECHVRKHTVQPADRRLERQKGQVYARYVLQCQTIQPGYIRLGNLQCLGLRQYVPRSTVVLSEYFIVVDKAIRTNKTHVY